MSLYPHDRELRDLMAEIRSYPDVDSLSQGVPAARLGDLVVLATHRVGGDEIALFTTIAVIGDAHDLTLAELRLETFWPVDPESARRWRRLIA